MVDIWFLFKFRIFQLVIIFKMIEQFNNRDIDCLCNISSLRS